MPVGKVGGVVRRKRKIKRLGAIHSVKPGDDRHELEKLNNTRRYDARL